MIDTKQEAAIAALLKKVGDYQVKMQEDLDALEVDEKDLNQLVSQVDITSEKTLVAGLKKITPGCGFVTEEETIQDNNKDHCWIIDPLDGTTNFLFGHDIFSISIAYQVKEETVFGAVLVPKLNQYFMANQTGAYLNSQPISVSTKAALKETLLATGFPYYNFNEMDGYLAVLEELMKSTKGLRRMGSAAIDLVYTAMGRFDAFYELNLNAWDIAAGSFIVQQAGGQVTDFRNGDGFGDGKRIIASNGLIHQQLLAIISTRMT